MKTSLRKDEKNIKMKKRVKKRKKKVFTRTLKDVNFLYVGGCDISYDTYYPCHNGFDCCDNDFCRCGEISNTEIKEVPCIEEVVNRVSKFYGFVKKIDLYACDRILRLAKAYSEDFFEIKVEGGYYGQEIRGVYITESNVNKLEKVFGDYKKAKTLREKVEFLLNLEYGYVLDSLKNRKTKA